MPYPHDHKQKTRDRILDAARREFLTHGFHGAGVDAIMASAGLTRGGFYNHFKSKEDLFAAVLDSAGPPAGAERDSANFIRRYLSPRHRREVDKGCVLAPLAQDVARAGEDAKAAYTRFLSRGVDSFDLPKEDAAAILALCVGGLHISRAVASDRMAREILRACRTAALAMLESSRT